MRACAPRTAAAALLGAATLLALGARVGLVQTSDARSGPPFATVAQGRVGPLPGDPVAIDLTVEGGEPRALELVPGRSYRIDQIDLTASDDRDEDDELQAIMQSPGFAQLDWSGLELAFSDSLADLAGQPFLQEIYRDAHWMIAAHEFSLTPLDADQQPLGDAIPLRSDADAPQLPGDDFPIRRPAVIRFIQDGHYHTEVWLQLRNAAATPAAGRTFEVGEATAFLELAWPTAQATYRFPVALVTDRSFAYGFGIDLEILNPPPGGQPFKPGDEVEVRVTFRDGAGERLHPEGSLPTYNEFLAGLESGLRYFDFQQGVLFFKDKNKEGVLLSAIAGPDDRVRQIHTEVPFDEFARPQQAVALPERDGYLCTWQLVPPADVLFGGLQDPSLWDTPVSDRMRFRLPRNARPGQYMVMIKARRVYRSESSLVTTIMRLPVDGPGLDEGAPAVTYAADGTTVEASSPPAPLVPQGEEADIGWVGRCADCHRDEFHLRGLLHSNGVDGSCAACHAPLAFEPDNMLAYRVHYVHYFSRRNPMTGKDCEACHIDPRSVERGSLMVCISCHLEYHGGAEWAGLYDRCDWDICHPAHKF